MDPTTNEVETDHTPPSIAAKQKSRDFENAARATEEAWARGQAPKGVLSKVFGPAAAASMVGSSQMFASVFYSIASYIQRHEGE